MKFIPKQTRISYGGAMIGLEEVKVVMDVMLDSGGKRWTVGPESIAFEQELAEVTGVKHAVVVNSGSSALLLAVAALKLPKGSRIAIPACNFPTAFNAILQNGHIPVVIDCELETFNIDLAELEKAIYEYPTIKAVIAVNIAGNPVDLVKVREIIGNDRIIILDNCIAKGSLILTDNGEVPIEEIKIGDMVMTRKGYRRVLRTIYKGIQPVITRFGVTATPDHKFITPQCKKELNVLKPSDILYLWNQKLSIIEEKSIEDILKQNNDIEESIFTVEKSFFIDNFGKTALGRYLKDIIFIIRIMIRLITSYPIYSVLLQKNTLAYTSSKREDLISHKGISLLQEREQLNGISQQKVKSGIINTTNGYGQLEKGSRNIVQYVKKNMKLIGLLSPNIVQENVNQEAEVYDLTVEDAHEFFANGILVSNCDGYGTTLNNKFVETFADIACVSFHAAHIITMGEGGAVLTDNSDYAERALKMREWGRVSGSDKIYAYPGFPDDYRERYVYEEIGYNVKPLELQCAMGRVQLKRLSEFKAARLDNFLKLSWQFHEHPILKRVGYNADYDPCWFSFPLLVRGGNARGPIMDYFEENNIETRTVFSGNITRHPAYKDSEYFVVGDLKNADEIMKRGMFLSCHPSLTSDMIDFIGEVASQL